MLACNINKNSYRYQTLKKMSGISEFTLDNTISMFQEKFGRFPELDELPNVNSEPYLRQALKISKDTVKIKDLLEYTGAESVQEANILLNNQYKDLEINIIPYSESAIINITHRSSLYNQIDEDLDLDTENTPIKSKQVLLTQLEQFRNFYGANIIPITTSEIRDMNILNAGNVKGFIYNGNIYLNIDNATIDTPIHEMMHLFFGAIRYTDPEIYFNLVNSIEQLPNYNKLAENFVGRTRGDINEEVFVQEFSKYISGEQSSFDTMDKSILSKLFYNIYRNIDTIISGKYSSKGLSNAFDKSIIQLSELLQSDIINNKFSGSLTPDVIHRVLANFKEDLIKKGQLEERCDG